MPADTPDEPDMPPDGHGDRRDDQNGPSGRAGRSDGTEAETRSRQECYDQLRMEDSIRQSARARQASADEQAAYEKWSEKREEAHWMWGEYQRKWPREERSQVDKSEGEPGSWRGEGNRKLDAADNARVEAACDRIAKLEKDKITPAMRAIESQDADRHLVGIEHCRKGRDRIKEKVCDKQEEFGFSAEEAVSEISDAVRYTFEYRQARYTEGVWADIGRLKNQDFELCALKNSWSQDQYKGINSQWTHPGTGQRFEVQFHTRISFEAKQLTHDAYKRIRTNQLDEFEKMVLKAFQRKVSTEIPVPRGAEDIPDYP